MAPSQFEKAESDKESIKDQLTFLEQELADHRTTALPRATLESYLEEAAEVKKQLTENHKTIRSVAPKGTDLSTHVSTFQTLSRMASRVHSGFHGAVMALPPLVTPTTTTPRSSAAPPHQTIKLPPLELPKFGGNLQEWVTFRDLFTTAVHRSSLTNVEKLTQLKSLLTGEAARQIRSLILSDANYDIAWKSLQERYENNRELLFSIIRRLINQPSISNGSVTSVRSLIDTTKECVRSLEILAIPTQHWDAILLYILFSKLDSTSRELWEQSLPDTSIPPLSKLYEFLEQRARALAASTCSVPRQQGKQPQTSVKTHHVATSTCKLGCSTAHPIFRCESFKSQTPQQRSDTARKLNLCFNCLGGNHSSSSCPSSRTCKFCNRKHNTLLHLEGGRPQQAINQESQQSSQGLVSSHHVIQNGKRLTTGVLATARINITSQKGKFPFRCLIDGGSTNSYITEAAAKKLGLKLSSCQIPMSGFASTPVGCAEYVTSFTFSSHFNNSSFSTTALVVKELSNNIPSERLKREEWPHLKNLALADPEYYQPKSCDILLGTDIFWDILQSGKISGTPGQPHAINSSLGWLVAGSNINATAITVFNVNVDLGFQLQRFWEQESIVESSPMMTADEQKCEEHFQSTHKRDEQGRFTVSLPFKDDRHLKLGSSRHTAVRRFLNMERRFSNPTTKDPEILRKLSIQWSAYIDFMREYESLGHMKLIPPERVISDKPTYYIPHHSVLKESSTTTKLRVVFDASAPASCGNSLNDCLLIGPKLQDDLRDILLRFRIYLIAFISDIQQMYRQIKMAPEDQDFQRIIWREHPSLPLLEYWLTTVTYGEGPTPYQAVKCLQQLAKDEAHRFPEAARILLRDFYVDDNASGCNSVEEGKRIIKQLIDLCMSGGFQLRKWTTNSQELLESIPEELRETKSLVELQHDSNVKTLGIFWDPREDKYSFKLSMPPDMPGKLSKRSILSQIAKIYDPLGWLAPAIIVCKIYMQELWKTKLDWDDDLPTTIQDHWIKIKSSLLDIEKIRIPRCVIPAPAKRIILVGACDASIKAISATVYVCCEYDDNSTSCNLLTAKTRVAPVKHVTLPRLELNGAVLLSELLQSTVKALQMKFHAVRAFTDSTITLHWITSTPTRWKPYIRRRVQAIQENIPTAEWFHIPGEHNPADCASRGLPACDLLNHQLWWKGTLHFFTPDNSSSADLLEEEITQIEAEAQPVTIHHVQPKFLLPVFTKYSSFLKLQRVVALTLRFAKNCRGGTKTTGSLLVSELSKSHNIILRLLQQSVFPLEYDLLSKNKPLSTTCSLLKLQPFIDKEGLLRVGGRIRHASVRFGQKHPILLPRKTVVTNSIIWDYHLIYLHAGASATLVNLQQRYWITNGRDTVRMVLKKCATCARHQASLLKQVMGDLPSYRITPSRPFSRVGVDYAGPISIRPMVRSKVTLKCWLAIFVCFATRAIHIEVVSSLSSDCFLAALRRFVARRGKPTDIFSDCGTNFKGTDRALREFFSLTQQKTVQEECSSQSISWHFNPAGAPHFGGLWEAGVKSIKYHLKRVMGSSTLTYEEMLTLVTQIEGILNSRPLVPASTDPSDLEVLTPAHFLIGTSLTSLPEQIVEDTKECYLKRWQLIQQRQQMFWRRWSSEYLSRLQQRPKWWKPSANLEVGSLVLIKDERFPPLKWKMGRVLAVHPGEDGRVRVVTLRTTDGEIKRPVVKLSLLPIQN